MIVVLLLSVLLSLVASFSIPPTATTTTSRQRRLHPLFAGDLEYEYVPPNPKAPSGDANVRDLPSSYPPGTPPGLCGEAVRSAMVSGRCVGWNLEDTPCALSIGGVLQIKGKGTVDFLNNKLTQDFQTSSSYQEACLLDAKGRVVDRLRVAMIAPDTAWILTSPGHSTKQLLEKFSPFIFPLDQVELTHLEHACIFTLASTQWSHVQDLIQTQVVQDSSFALPTRSDMCVHQSIPGPSGDTNLVVIPSTGLPSAACVGYTLIFTSPSKDTQRNTAGTSIWKHLISDENTKGPIHAGALEYEDLRIEAGQAAFGKEIAKATKASPLELHWQRDTINTQKGCYLGQEGVASMLKNIRGPPRILYSVVFDDDENVYETQSRGDGSQIENLTRPPKIGDVLYVLGSNEEISVGTVTSVAQPGGSGEPCTLGLVLIRRADSIRKQMKGLDLEIHRDEPQVADIVDEASGIIQPPPLDPLDGLEIIIGGSFTMGKLRMVPSRRWRRGKNMLDCNLQVEELVDEGRRSASSTQLVTTAQPQVSEEDELQRAVEDAVKAQAEADAAAAEAKRKADKMEMLKKRAEEAMARKKAAKEKKE